jgi:hypothetical protein
LGMYRMYFPGRPDPQLRQPMSTVRQADLDSVRAPSVMWLLTGRGRAPARAGVPPWRWR